jgi:acetyl esterase/lipase
VEYRLSPVAPFPAQVHDIKSAIRFLRAKGHSWGITADQIVIAGASAGGHLAALVGVSNNHPELEGSVGHHQQESSSVQGIISFYGAANLKTILSQSTPHGLSVRVPALRLLLGGDPEEKEHLLTLASPVTHVDGDDPPLLLIHGDQDLQMPINQAHELAGVYKKVGRPVHFEVIHGAGHGGLLFYHTDRLRLVMDFLEQHFDRPE